MLEKTYLTLILIFFIFAFAIKNIKTFLATRQSIRANSVKVTITIIISTIIYCLILLRLTIIDSIWIIEFDLSGYEFIKTIGFVFVSIGFMFGILALIAMKNSWRVGIKYEQKTDLVTTGIYKFSRNPYFLSYDILIFGYILVFPSLVLIVLYLPLTIFFHKMILEEEKYLQSVHGELYMDYKSKVNRYLTVK